MAACPQAFHLAAQVAPPPGRSTGPSSTLSPRQLLGPPLLPPASTQQTGRACKSRPEGPELGNQGNRKDRFVRRRSLRRRTRRLPPAKCHHSTVWTCFSYTCSLSSRDVSPKGKRESKQIPLHPLPLDPPFGQFGILKHCLITVALSVPKDLRVSSLTH